jgi:hypothetical protein
LLPIASGANSTHNRDGYWRNLCENPHRPTDEIACWWEETTITTHLRVAAGVCVLTTGLLIGSAGGAIAAADTDSTGSTSTQSQATEDPSQSVSPANAPTGTVTATPPKSTPPTLRDIIRKLQSLGKPRQRPVVVEATTDPVTTGTETAKTDKKDTEVAAATSDTAGSDSNTVATDSNGTTPATNVSSSNSDVPASSTELAPPLATVVAPVTNAVATVAAVALSVPGVVMSLPTSTTPVADVVTLVQEMLTAVNDVVAAVAQVPTDLYSLLGVAAANATVIHDGVDGAAGLSAAAGAALPPPMSPVPAQVLPVSGIQDPSGLGNVTAPTLLGGIAAAGLSQDLSTSGTAPLATEGAGPTSALSFLEHTVRAVLAPASLSALAAIALPGIGGLLIVCAAGMRVGYRQAKAVLAVRSTGIARFTRQGPLGVVRTGSLVALHSRSHGVRHPRALRVVRPEVSRAAPLLEQVA